MTTSGINRMDRNIYVRYILKILVETYLINQAQLAYRIGVQPKYLREFTNGSRNIGNKRLDDIEEVISELYKPILDDELPSTPEELNNLLEIIRP